MKDSAVPQQLDTCDLTILFAVSLAFITSTVVSHAISVDALFLSMGAPPAASRRVSATPMQHARTHAI